MGKIVITGTGRCGTSFLMHLFTALGFNTGYTVDECEQHLKRSGCNGGIEHEVKTERFESADIVKNPIWLYEPHLLDQVDIDCIIIPLRNFESVAKSREIMGVDTYGGFWRGATNIDEQMRIDAFAIGMALNYFISNDMEILFLDFERLMHHSYLRKKLMPIIMRIDPSFGGYSDFQAQMKFVQVHEDIAKPEFIHF